MSNLKVTTINADELGTILDSDVEFDGEMELESAVLIRGTVKGSISCKDDVFIGEQARIEADILADRVSVKGRVQANIEARERLELFRTARVQGSISTPDLICQSGARLQGSCNMPISDKSEEEELQP